MRVSRFSTTLFLAGVVLLQGCQDRMFQPSEAPPPGLSNAPAVRLSFKYEADVPAPSNELLTGAEERHAAIQSDFDASRPLELLDRTIISPDKQRVVAVYHRISDVPSEYRLDMYSADGQLLRKITSDTMAVHFPDTIVWSPDSATLAFVAMIRVFHPESSLSPTGTPTPSPEPTAGSEIADNIDEIEPMAEISPTPGTPTPAPPTGIMTFRTEQIYICGADGVDVKPLTENEGLIYFYYAWSPDSTMLVALSATAREWRYLEVVAESKGEVLVPQGRPRVIEKNGRERRLDDNLTSVRPVWSPDSSKVAAAFDNQIRIYDAIGTNPTQAAIPLRNQLLISSQAYDRLQEQTLRAANNDANIEVAPVPEPTAEQPLSTLPDEKLLVSYNPIVELAWTSDELLYLQTAYLRRMKNEAESVRSFSRWHRLILSSQPEAANK